MSHSKCCKAPVSGGYCKDCGKTCIEIYNEDKTTMIQITKKQEIVDDVAGEVKYVIESNGEDGIMPITLTLPEARELLEELNKKLK